MRKNFIVKLIVALCLAGVVLPVQADNSIKMVTYFPVPYVTYNNLFIRPNGMLEIGTRLDGSFMLNVGSASSESLTANTIELNDSTTLRFDVDLATPAQATFGPNTPNNDVALRFENLRINSIDSSLDKPITSLKATNSLVVDGKTYLFEKFFANESAAALPACAGTVTWKRLNINSHVGYFLVCDAADVPPAETKNCPSKTNKITHLNTAQIECAIPLATETVSQYCAQLNTSNPITGNPSPIMNMSICSITAPANPPFTWSSTKGYTWFETSGSCEEYYEDREWAGDTVCMEVVGPKAVPLWNLPTCDSDNKWRNIDMRGGVWYPAAVHRSPGLNVFTITCADEE